jgi:hypothetical protein
VGGLAHYLEEDGIPTTQISLVRLHTEKMRPPRSLWVPFELGRPLGAPGDPAFQTRVIRTALGLLGRADGPVILEDYGEEAPADLAARDDGEGWACPINLPAPPVDLEAGGGFRAALLDEVRRMQPWYDMAVEAHGRTTVGLSGLDMEAVVERIGFVLDGNAPEPDDRTVPVDWIKFAVDDLKAFYREAAAVQPGANTGDQVNDWFYGETVAGRALFALRRVVMDLGERIDDPGLTRFGAALLIPLTQRHREAAR